MRSMFPPLALDLRYHKRSSDGITSPLSSVYVELHRSLMVHVEIGQGGMGRKECVNQFPRVSRQERVAREDQQP